MGGSMEYCWGVPNSALIKRVSEVAFPIEAPVPWGLSVLTSPAPSCLAGRGCCCGLLVGRLKLRQHFPNVSAFAGRAPARSRSPERFVECLPHQAARGARVRENTIESVVRAGISLMETTCLQLVRWYVGIHPRQFLPRAFTRSIPT